MKIDSIKNSNINYKGYLHKSVYGYVNTAASNAKRELYSISSKVPKKQLDTALKYMDSIKKITISNLEEFVKKCHPKSYLVMEERNGSLLTLNFNNKSVKLNFGIPATSLLKLDNKFSDSEIINPTRISNHRGYYNDNDLKQLERFSEELVQINPNSADKAILRGFKVQAEEERHSVFGKLIEKKNAKKIKAFSDEISK